MAESQFFWCVKHSRVEAAADVDSPGDALGPYPTEAAARDWKARNEARNESWDAADKAWEGEDADDED